jgi:hypothetical protein
MTLVEALQQFDEFATHLQIIVDETDPNRDHFMVYRRIGQLNAWVDVMKQIVERPAEERVFFDFVLENIDQRILFVYYRTELNETFTNNNIVAPDLSPATEWWNNNMTTLTSSDSDTIIALIDSIYSKLSTIENLYFG